ncbi:hypothetical protein PTTG_27753 [Puccinia triticina 1-1 BBBD Race 1]|uniref:aspartate--tRNA ligase n=1 Tax=Puccinia triticina (isolate 1-1 / race 1 (BBBD)) TaxID=630390 RepID=A0A180GJI6_PUCT1|nr:hypothetical protein PTTG_27753 [Puccinia triticina 1-1 BBBD Race 1]
MLKNPETWHSKSDPQPSDWQIEIRRVEGKKVRPPVWRLKVQHFAQDPQIDTHVHEVSVVWRPPISLSVWGKALQIFLLAKAPAKLPFLLEDASRPVDLLPKEGKQFVTVGTNTRLDNRVLDLQTPVNQAIFRVQLRVCNLFCRFLDNKGFIEIHTPKIQGAATESGASVFKLGYFERNAFLAQSPQLAKQMAIAADFERVYEIGPIFWAENSNTYLHIS